MEQLITAAIFLLVLTVIVLSVLLFRYANSIFRLRTALDESESRRRDISNFLTRFSAGIKGEEGFFGAMNAAAIHIGEQTDCESVAIYIIDNGALRGVSVYGTYPLVKTANKLVFTRRRHLLETLKRETIPAGEGFLGGMILSRQAEQVPSGAQDERFAAAVSNDSGYGGAASSKRGEGERVTDLGLAGFRSCGPWTQQL